MKYPSTQRPKSPKDDLFCVSAEDEFWHYKNRIGTCKKEARETKFFLRMVAVAVESLKPDARALWLEAREPHLISCSIFAKQKTDEK